MHGTSPARGNADCNPLDNYSSRDKDEMIDRDDRDKDDRVEEVEEEGGDFFLETMGERGR